MTEKNRDSTLLALVEAVARLARRQTELESELKAVTEDTAKGLDEIFAILKPLALAAQRSLARQAKAERVN